MVRENTPGHRYASALDATAGCQIETSKLIKMDSLTALSLLHPQLLEASLFPMQMRQA